MLVLAFAESNHILGSESYRINEINTYVGEGKSSPADPVHLQA